MSDPALRAYLLGKLTESEVELVENRLIEDEDLFSRMETAEDDLFDAYTRGVLGEDERRRFLHRFGGDLARRRFARAFVRRTAAGKVVPFYRRRWVELTMAASLVIVVGAVMARRQPDAAAPVPTASTPAAAAPAPSALVIARVTLALSTSRAAGAPVIVTVDPTATQLDLAVRLNRADRFAVYAIEIRSRANNIVWADAALSGSVDGGDLVVHAMVPGDRLPGGSYEVSVRGGASATSLDDLGFLTLEVNRAQ